MDKAQVQKSPSTSASKQSTQAKSTHASKNNSHQLHDIPTSSTENFSPDHLMHLQRTIGNQAVGRMIQAKMSISKPDDKYEREADHVADKVMRMPEPAKAADEEKKSVPNANSPVVQRLPDKKPDEQHKTVQTKSLPARHFPQVSRLASNSIGAVNRAANANVAVKPPEERKPDVVQRKKARYQLHDDHSEEKKRVQAKGTQAPTPQITPAIAANINALNHRGSPLPRATRAFFEPRFGVDFSQVRVHTDSHAAETAHAINAKAFTVGPNIAFARGQFAPDSDDGRKLIAHELTHTIQQGAGVQRSSDGEPVIQREEGSWWDSLPNPLEYLRKVVIDYISKHAEAIPGFTMLTIILGRNPLTGAAVDRSPGNILKGAIEMIPGGSNITQALNNHGVFDKISGWAAQQFNTLKAIGSNILQDVKGFISNFSIVDLKEPSAVWERAKNIVTAPIGQIKAFAIGLKNDIVTFVKDAILKPIAAFAKANLPNGYDLLCAVMGKDPISGEPVKQTAENLIAPFMKLIGQEEVWENMKKANALGRAWAWFQGALGSVKAFVQEIPTLFINAFKALDITDIILIPRAFGKLIGVFSGFAGRFVTWAGNAVWNLLEIIVESLGKTGLLGYIKRTGAALRSILKNPLPFVGNLVKAAINGFKNFAANFAGHLKTGLIDWLTGSLSGVYIPKELSLAEMGKFAFSVLGISWALIRGKIVKALGPKGETIMQGLETGFDIVVALVKGGPAAAWELLKEKLSDLKDVVVGGIISFVTDTVISKAVPKLLSLFIPGAGFISALISIYDTIMVFVQKLSKIGQVVSAFIDSIVTIAAGNTAAASSRIESVLGGLVSLAISFLAGFVGLGKVADKIVGVIQKVLGAIDKAWDWVINMIVSKAKALFGKLFGGKDKKDERTDAEKKRDKLAAIDEAEKLLREKDTSEQKVRNKLGSIKNRYKLLTLNLIVDAKKERTETVHFTASASQEEIGQPKEIKLESAGGLVASVKVTTRTVSKETQEKLKSVEQEWEQYELGAMQNVVVGELIPEWEERTGVPITTEKTKLESAQYMARLKTQKAFRVGSRRPRPEARVEIKSKGGKGEISNVFVVEVTTVRDLTDTSGSAVRHKLAQIPNTIETLINKYGTGPQIEYTIICPRDLKPEEQSTLEGLLNRPDAKNLKIVWVKTGV